MRVLVTGGAGFIGSFVVDRLIEKGHSVRIFDNLDSQVHPSGMPDYINKKAEFMKGDITNPDDVKNAIKNIDWIFHFASAVGVAQSMYEIRHYTSVNVGGTANLLDCIVNSKNEVKKIVVAASMSSYGEGQYYCKKCGPVRPGLRNEEQLSKKQWEPKCPNCGSAISMAATKESAELQPNSIYSINKMSQEQMVFSVCKTYGIKAVSLRFFNVYGPRQSLSNPYTGVAAIFMSRIKNNNPPVINEDGLQTRDFVSVHDVSEACVLAMESDRANYEIFNVGSGKATPIKDVAEKLIRIYGKDLKPDIRFTSRKGDVRHCYSDITKLKEKLNFIPKVALDSGLCELVEWSRTAEAKDGFAEAEKEAVEKGIMKKASKERQEKKEKSK